jgi:hypothetical protein
MKITKTLRLTVRVREFETVQVEVGVVADHHDLGYDENWLVQLSNNDRKAMNKQVRALVVQEVESLAREELEKISAWSDFSPNLADDYLGSTDVRTEKDHSPSARRIHR